MTWPRLSAHGKLDNLDGTTWNWTLPGGIADGSLILVHLVTDDADRPGPTTGMRFVTSKKTYGYTASTVGYIPGNTSWVLYYVYYASGGITSFSFTWTAGTSGCLRFGVYKDVDPETPIDSFKTFGYGSTAADISVPSHTPYNHGCMLVAYLGVSPGSSVTDAQWHNPRPGVYEQYDTARPYSTLSTTYNSYHTTARLGGAGLEYTQEVATASPVYDTRWVDKTTARSGWAGGATTTHVVVAIKPSTPPPAPPFVRSTRSLANNNDIALFSAVLNSATAQVGDIIIVAVNNSDGNLDLMVDGVQPQTSGWEPENGVGYNYMGYVHTNIFWKRVTLADITGETYHGFTIRGPSRLTQAMQVVLGNVHPTEDPLGDYHQQESASANPVIHSGEGDAPNSLQCYFLAHRRSSTSGFTTEPSAAFTLGREQNYKGSSNYYKFSFYYRVLTDTQFPGDFTLSTAGVAVRTTYTAPDIEPDPASISPNLPTVTQPPNLLGSRKPNVGRVGI